MIRVGPPVARVPATCRLYGRAALATGSHTWTGTAPGATSAWLASRLGPSAYHQVNWTSQKRPGCADNQDSKPKDLNPQTKPCCLVAGIGPWWRNSRCSGSRWRSRSPQTPASAWIWPHCYKKISLAHRCVHDCTQIFLYERGKLYRYLTMSEKRMPPEICIVWAFHVPAHLHMSAQPPCLRRLTAAFERSPDYSSQQK